jgi:hypothetical protein
VTENAEDAGEERLRYAVTRAPLRDQKFHERLADRQAAGSHFHPRDRSIELRPIASTSKRGAIGVENDESVS